MAATGDQVVKLWPMDTREAVRSRIALALPDERTHGQVFVDTLGGFSQLYGSEVAEQARAAASVPVELGLFSCPIAELLRVTDAGASAAEAQGLASYSEALERIGIFLASSYQRSPVGQAFRRITGSDVLKSMELSMASTRAVTTYGNRRFERLGPSSARIVFNRELMGPLWIRGIYTKAFQASSGLDSLSASVEFHREPGMDFALLYTWTLS
ncbi:DUF2378 family protein [Archangium violaceum]|nr:DUF2378 family protein [Archangium violaceum]